MPNLLNHLHVIADHYRDKRTERTGQPLMKHIWEGIEVIRQLGGSIDAQDAYALHPLVQSDEDFMANSDKLHSIPAHIVILVMEYRNKANACLSDSLRDEYGDYRMPTIPNHDIVLMLLADKIQNQKDFLRYHFGVHERSDDLEAYFNQWLDHLWSLHRSFHLRRSASD